MDKISIVSLLTVSFPETLLFTLLAVILVGKANLLKNRFFIIRLLVYTIISTAAFYFIRPYVANIVENIIVTLIMYSLLFIFIMGFRVHEAVLTAFISVVLLVVVEIVYIEPYLAIRGIKIEQVFESDLHRILLSLPERVIQILVAWIAIKRNWKLFDFGKPSYKKHEFYLHIFIYLISSTALVFLIALMTRLLIFTEAGPTDAASSVFFRLNAYVAAFTIIVLLMAIKSASEFYKRKKALTDKELLQSIEYMEKLAHDGSYEELMDSLKSLKDHIANSVDN